MPGASGTIAGNATVKASPDGYTLYFGSASAISPLFNKNNGVDAIKSLAPVSNFGSAPYTFYVGAKLPINSIQDLVAYSKANPGKLNFGSGAANAAILASVLASRTGLDYQNIAYKGTGPIVGAILNGDVAFTATVSTGNFASHVRAGTIRVLFVTMENRFALMPHIPTAAEFGIKDFVAITNLGLWAPLMTPKDVIQKLSAAGAAAVKTADVSEKLRDVAVAVQPDGSTPEELLRLFTQEMNFWSEAARISNYRPE